MKINGGFQSLFEYSENKYKLIPRMSRFNTNPRNTYLDQYIGSIQPIVSIGNDFVDTVTPYKSAKDIAGDASQPVAGFVNLFTGLQLIVYLPFMLVFFAWKNRNYPEFQKTTLKELAFSGSWLIHGCAKALHGISQIITTPFTWIVKMPLRGMLTAIYGFSPVEESLQYLIKHTEKPVTEENHYQSWILARVIHEKYMKAAAKGQPSKIGYKTERSAFKPLHSIWRYNDSDIQNYFKLFAHSKQDNNNQSPEMDSANIYSTKVK